jgi:predicted MFS family arabinose efflux permease
VFATAAIVGGGALGVAALAPSLGVFAVAGAVGGGVLASLGFYHVTQTTAVRVSPGAEERAIAVLTIWGAFASVVYIPLAAWLVTRLDWRATLLILAASASTILLVGVALLDTRRRDSHSAAFRDVGRSVTTGRARRFLISQTLAGIGVGTILVYQVPAMTAAGLALGAASFWAGFRGFAQLGGRLPLMPLVRSLGVANTLRLAYAAIAVGSMALAFAGNHLLAAVYAVVAGFGIGAVSPLVGMHSRNVFGEASLGTAMGLVSLVFYGASAVGPVATAALAEATGSRSLPVAVSAAIVGSAALVVRSSD